jgi:nucleotide-binding universal stress UspA family protein
MTPISRILVPIDFSEPSDQAFAYAKRFAEQVHASVHLVHALEDRYVAASFTAGMYATHPVSLRTSLLQEAEQRLAERFPVDERERFNGTIDVILGPPDGSIVERADSLDANLIVMGTHGRGGVAHLLLGSVAERVVRHARCPVLTIKAATERPVRTILAPTDFSAASDAALDYAYLLAAHFGARVQLLHVLRDPFANEGVSAEAYLTEVPHTREALLASAHEWLQRRARRRPAGVEVSTEGFFGNGAKTITDYASHAGADLIVMGTHGRTGVAHFVLGSVAEHVVRTAPCPVLTLRHVTAPRGSEELLFDVATLPA